MSQQAFYPSNHRSPDLGGHIRPRSRNQSFRNANTTGSVFFNNTTTNATTSNATSSIFTNSSHLGQTGLRGELSIKKRSSRSPGMKSKPRRNRGSTRVKGRRHPQGSKSSRKKPVGSSRLEPRLKILGTTFFELIGEIEGCIKAKTKPKYQAVRMKTIDFDINYLTNWIKNLKTTIYEYKAVFLEAIDEEKTNYDKIAELKDLLAKTNTRSRKLEDKLNMLLSQNEQLQSQLDHEASILKERSFDINRVHEEYVRNNLHSNQALKSARSGKIGLKKSQRFKQKNSSPLSPLKHTGHLQGSNGAVGGAGNTEVSVQLLRKNNELNNKVKDLAEEIFCYKEEIRSLQMQNIDLVQQRNNIVSIPSASVKNSNIDQIRDNLSRSRSRGHLHPQPQLQIPIQPRIDRTSSRKLIRRNLGVQGFNQSSQPNLHLKSGLVKQVVQQQSRQLSSHPSTGTLNNRTLNFHDMSKISAYMHGSFQQLNHTAGDDCLGIIDAFATGTEDTGKVLCEGKVSRANMSRGTGGTGSASAAKAKKVLPNKPNPISTSPYKKRGEATKIIAERNYCKRRLDFVHRSRSRDADDSADFGSVVSGGVSALNNARIEDSEANCSPLNSIITKPLLSQVMEGDGEEEDSPGSRKMNHIRRQNHPESANLVGSKKSRSPLESAKKQAVRGQSRAQRDSRDAERDQEISEGSNRLPRFRDFSQKGVLNKTIGNVFGGQNHGGAQLENTREGLLTTPSSKSLIKKKNLGVIVAHENNPDESSMALAINTQGLQVFGGTNLMKKSHPPIDGGFSNAKISLQTAGPEMEVLGETEEESGEGSPIEQEFGSGSKVLGNSGLLDDIMKDNLGERGNSNRKTNSHNKHILRTSGGPGHPQEAPELINAGAPNSGVVISRNPSGLDFKKKKSNPLRSSNPPPKIAQNHHQHQGQGERIISRGNSVIRSNTNHKTGANRVDKGSEEKTPEIIRRSPIRYHQHRENNPNLTNNSNSKCNARTPNDGGRSRQNGAITTSHSRRRVAAPTLRREGGINRSGLITTKVVHRCTEKSPKGQPGKEISSLGIQTRQNRGVSKELKREENRDIRGDKRENGRKKALPEFKTFKNQPQYAREAQNCVREPIYQNQTRSKNVDETSSSRSPLTINTTGRQIGGLGQSLNIQHSPHTMSLSKSPNKSLMAPNRSHMITTPSGTLNNHSNTLENTSNETQNIERANSSSHQKYSQYREKDANHSLFPEEYPTTKGKNSPKDIRSPYRGRKMQTRTQPPSELPSPKYHNMNPLSPNRGGMVLTEDNSIVTKPRFGTRGANNDPDLAGLSNAVTPRTAYNGAAGNSRGLNSTNQHYRNGNSEQNSYRGGLMTARDRTAASSPTATTPAPEAQQATLIDNQTTLSPFNQAKEVIVAPEAPPRPELNSGDRQAEIDLQVKEISNIESNIQNRTVARPGNVSLSIAADLSSYVYDLFVQCLKEALDMNKHSAKIFQQHMMKERKGLRTGNALVSSNCHLGGLINKFKDHLKILGREPKLKIEEMIMIDCQQIEAEDGDQKSSQKDLGSKLLLLNNIDITNPVFIVMKGIAKICAVKQNEPEVIILYRYLGLKHRTLNPSRAEHKAITQEIEVILDRAICESSLRFVESTL